MNINTLVGIHIIFTLGGEDEIYLKIIERTGIGLFISANNVIFLELEGGYNFNIHLDSNSSFLEEF